MARKEKILVALSGGPASAIAASLLRNQDYDLIAVHAKVSHAQLPVSHCCPERDEARVTRLCEKLSIPLIIEDITQAVEGSVLAPLLEGRLTGQMTDPCIVFHSEVLLPKLWEIAQRSRATQIASGHFARIGIDQNTQRTSLYGSTDPASDQSPLLSRTPNEVLSHLQLPLSGIPETMMKKLAEELGLDLGPMKLRTSDEDGDERDRWAPWAFSCYPEESLNLDLFKRYTPPAFMKAGAVRSTEEYTTAEHRGVGEARIGLPSREMSGQTVLNINFPTQTIVVGSASRIHLKSWQLHSTFFRRNREDSLKSVEVRARLAGRPGWIEGILDRYSAGYSILNLSEPTLMPTPGQVLVFYDQNEVIGSAYMSESPVKLESK